jgi:hypothetical protein
MRGHDLQDETQAKENPTAPPADGREEIACLADTNQRVRRRARASKARGEPTALSALQQNREHDDQAIDDEQRQKKRVKH